MTQEEIKAIALAAAGGDGSDRVSNSSGRRVSISAGVLVDGHHAAAAAAAAAAASVASCPAADSIAEGPAAAEETDAADVTPSASDESEDDDDTEAAQATRLGAASTGFGMTDEEIKAIALAAAGGAVLIA